VLKLTPSNPGHPVTHSPCRDDNRALNVVLGSRRHPLMSISAPPTGVQGMAREEDPRMPDRRARRLKLYAQRSSIAEQLAQARPDLVAPTYENKRQALVAREARTWQRSRAREMDKLKKKMNAHLGTTDKLLSIGTGR
jgi:DNA cross-link repair 1C protein